jgi:hypothetical protein
MKVKRIERAVNIERLNNPWSSGRWNDSKFWILGENWSESHKIGNLWASQNWGKVWDLSIDTPTGLLFDFSSWSLSYREIFCSNWILEVNMAWSCYLRDIFGQSPSIPHSIAECLCSYHRVRFSTSFSLSRNFRAECVLAPIPVIDCLRISVLLPIAARIDLIDWFRQNLRNILEKLCKTATSRSEPALA